MNNKLQKFASIFATEFEGPSIDNVIKTAINTLKMSKEELQIKILSEGRLGLFGLKGSKPAKIKVSPKVDKIENIIKFYFIQLLNFVNHQILFTEVKLKDNTVNIISILKESPESMLVFNKKIYNSILTLISSFIESLLPDYKVNIKFKISSSLK
ncbi:MAG: Jag N-terminal domain-containing protein [Endomicrobia bacterium]|nr:Jag N-terminal domain-containing protein [Endomicrobiia bacterium]MCX7716672.1 Jag N-terminal domain-containing protein [Endomicrobiia bacterium]